MGRATRISSLTRRFCGARLCEPQHVESDRRAGFVKTLGGRQSSCGSQTRAPLVAASPRWAVSQDFNVPLAACEQRSADCKSATCRQAGRYGRLKICAMVWRIGVKVRQPIVCEKNFTTDRFGSGHRRSGRLAGVWRESHLDANNRDAVAEGSRHGNRRPGGREEICSGSRFGGSVSYRRADAIRCLVVRVEN